MTYIGEADIPNRSGFSVSGIFNSCIALIIALPGRLHNTHLSVASQDGLPNDSILNSSLYLL